MVKKRQKMKPWDDNDLAFVAGCYDKGRFDTRNAIARFHETDSRAAHRRWWMTAAAAAASVAVLFAAGYGIRTWIRAAQEPAPVEQPAVTPEAAGTHTFRYDNTPVEQVLAELSAYYGCTLTTAPTDKRLTGTFPDGDVKRIVSAIESALGIQITMEP
jgi:Fe2+-dicitrate sensor, membrane component